MIKQMLKKAENPSSTKKVYVEDKLFYTEDFENMKQLGFGALFRAENNEFGYVGIDFCYTFLIKSGLYYKKLEAIRRAQTLNHPNIVRIYGLLVKDDVATCAGYVTEYMENRNVHHALHVQSKAISDSLKFSWIIQAGRALTYLHSKGFVYGQISTDRMLLANNSETLRFSLSRITLQALNPSIKLRNKPSGPAFNNRLIEENQKIFQPPDSSKIENEDIRILLKECWQKDGLKRPSVSQIVIIFSNKMKELKEKEKGSKYHENDDKSRYSKFALNVLNEGMSTFTEDDFSEPIPISEGAFGYVFKAQNSRFGEVAVKVHKNQWKFDGQRELFHMWKDSTHPNIIRFLGVLLHLMLQIPIGIVMEFMENKTVYDALHINKMPIDKEMKYSWICQAARALDYLHSRTLLHRDMKTLNMLLCNDFKNLKVCDMGTTRNFNCMETMTGGFDVGTLIYNAPEITASKRMDKYDSSVDIYSLAICVWEIVTRRKPFDHIVEENFPCTLALKAAEQDERPEASAIQDEEIRFIVERSWQKNSRERPSAAEIVAFFEEKYLEVCCNFDDEDTEEDENL